MKTFIGILLALTLLDIQSAYANSLYVGVMTHEDAAAGWIERTEDTGGFVSVEVKGTYNDVEALTREMQTRARAYVGLPSGSLGVFAVGQPGFQNPNSINYFDPGAAYASAMFNEKIYFTDPSEKDIFSFLVKYEIHGSFAAWVPGQYNGGPATATFEHLVQTTPGGVLANESGTIKVWQGGYITEEGLMNDHPFSPENTLQYAQTITMSKNQMINGVYELGISAYLRAYAFGGMIADFSNTGSISFDLPEGVTFTSESGYFLTAQQTPVPEPATMLLFGTGIAGLAVARRRKKKVS